LVCLSLLACPWAVSNLALAQTVTGISAIYNTGQTTSASLVSGGTQVQSGATAPTTSSGWYVTYASTNGGSSSSSTYEGDAYAITASAVSSSGYTANTTTAEWIVAPGAATSSSKTNTNQGGNYLPGNGTSGANEGIYVYTLAFTITGGTTGAKVTSPMSIMMTIAADDGYTVYVNPKGQGVNPTGAPSTYTASAAATMIANAWTNTTATTLGNSGTSNNSTFYIGTNYISVVVDNSNGVSGSSSATTWNESGLLVENTSADIGSEDVWANGKPVPEVTPWLPLVGAVALYGLFWLRHRSSAAAKTVLLA
jgi:hypothetical protein